MRKAKERELNDRKNANLNPNKEVVLKKAPQVSFTKASRFEEKKKEDEDSMTALSDLSREMLFPEKRIKITGGVIPVYRRFEDPKVRQSCSTDADYNPNYDYFHKKPTNIFIKKEENKEELLRKKRAKRSSLFPELTTSCKANLSMLTADTDTAVLGPGTYQPKYTFIEISKNVAISKASRFEPLKKDDFTPLDIRYTQVTPDPKGPKIQQPSFMNDKLTKRKLEVKELEENRAKFEIENAIKTKVEKEEAEKRRKEQLEQLRNRKPTEKERAIELFRLVNPQITPDGLPEFFAPWSRSIRS